MEAQVDYLGSEIESLRSPHAKHAVEFFNHLVKAVKAKLVYPSSSKLPDQFKAELSVKATEIFQQVDSLEYKIGTDTILYGDHKVFESLSRSENFAHVFFKDGIINLSFLAGISGDELSRFIDLIAKMMRTVYVDDDLATLLWEENFQYIIYELIDEGLEIDTIEYSTDRLKIDKFTSADDIQSLYIDEGEITFNEGDFEEADKAISLRQKGNAFNKMPQQTYDFLNQITVFTDADHKQLAALVADDARFDHIEYVLMVIFEILGMEKELSGYTETLKFIGKVRDNFISLGNFKGGAALLTRIKEMQGVLQNLHSPRAEKINEFFLECASAEKISIITETTNRLKDIDAEGLTYYLTQLPWAAIDPLIIALGDLKYYRARRTVCSVLAELGKDKIDLIARGLDDERWYVVRNIVMVLGQIANSRILNYLKKTIRHPDYRVRKETLNAAANVKSGDNVDFMILALSDPDVHIQMNALRYLMTNKCNRALKSIENILKNKKFKDRPTEQVKKFLEVYASIGQDSALPYLKPLAFKKTFFGSAKEERFKIIAIAAMGMIHTSESTNLLAKLAKSKKSKIAAAAARALNIAKRKE